MSVTVKLDSSNFRAKAEQTAQRAAQITMGELSAAFQQSFTAVAWTWPRRTVRSGGEVVGSPRNLIDNANLRQSHSWAMTGPHEGTFKWSARHATISHEGGYIRPWGNEDADLVYLPPRPWCRATLGLENVDGVVVYKLDERLRNVWMGYLEAGG